MSPPAVTARLEVEFVPGSGTYVNISSRCRTLTITRPRPGIAQAVSVTTLTAELDNAPDSTGFCPFTPDSAVGLYYPNVERDRRIRVTALSGASSWVRFHGWTDTWVPDMDAGGVGQSTVTVTASCVLGRYARRKVLSYYGETVLASANVDYWPLDDPVDTATVRGLSGDPAAFPARDGQIIVPSRPPGAAVLSEPDGGHLSDGQVEFSRGNDNAPAPVILLRTRPGQLVAAVSASFRLSTDPAGLTDDAVAAYDANGLRLWRWCASLVAGNITWTLFDDSDTAMSFYATASPRDDAWHHWKITLSSSTSSTIRLVDKGGATTAAGSFTWTYDPRPVAWLVLGGQMVPQRKGKQTNTLQGGISSFAVQYASGGVFDYSEFIVPGITSDAGRVATFLDAEGAALSSLTGGAITTGTTSDVRQVMYTNTTRTLLDRWNEHKVTVGGHLSTIPDGRRRYIYAEEARPVAVALTLDAADDLDIPAGGWQATKDERPTRVTAVGPAGGATVIDTATEAATGLKLDGPTLATSAGTVDLARSAAASVMAPRLARLSAFGLDATLTGTDKTAALMALRQSDRIRVTGLPPQYLGLTYQDVYASGWTETYVGEYGRCVFVFDTDTADDPTEAILDDAEYGRIGIGDGSATGTGGTCVGTTATGTLIVTSATSPQTNAGGEFPRDLDWNGERITVSAVGGSTSPQTFTVSARGVAPTVARVHVAGDSVEIWHAARAAL